MSYYVIFCSYDDLVVGAPFFSKMGMAEIGRIYVYTNQGVYASLVAMDTCYLGKFVKSYHLHMWNGYSR